MRSFGIRNHPHIANIAAALLLLGITGFTIQRTIPEPMPIYALLYLLGFMALAWNYPQTTLLITFAAGPFQNDVSGNFGPFRFSVVEINLLLTALVFFVRMAIRRMPLRTGSIMPAIWLYLGICLASTLPNWTSGAAPALLQTFLYLVITVVIYATFVDQADRLYGACLALIGVCLFLTGLEFVSGSGYVLGLHKNGVGSSLAVGVVVAAELWLAAPDLRRRLWIGSALAILVGGLLMSLSRGAWIGAAVGVVIVVLMRRQIQRVFALAIVLIPIALLFWNLLPQEKRDKVLHFDTRAENVRMRLATIDYSWSAFTRSPVMGLGVGVRKQIDATNVLLITLAETGVPGLLAFLLIHLQLIRMTAATARFVPRSDPRFSILVISTALCFCKLAHGIVDHYWSRGALSIVWASVGVSSGIYYSVMRQQTMTSRAWLSRRGEQETTLEIPPAP